MLTKVLVAGIINLGEADGAVWVVVVGSGDLAKLGLDATAAGAIGGIAFYNEDGGFGSELFELTIGDGGYLSYWRVTGGPCRKLGTGSGEGERGEEGVRGGHGEGEELRVNVDRLR